MKISELKNLFNAWAKSTDDTYTDKQWLLSKWDVLEGVEWDKEKQDLMIGSIVEGLDLKKEDRLLDLGCAGAWILKMLKPQTSDIVGLDFSFEMLQKARGFCPGEKFVCGEIGDLPIREGAFDCAISYFVFLNFLDDTFIINAILDAMKALKKNGRLLIGQLPDKSLSSDYDRAKEEYLNYCEKTYNLGKSIREECRAPQKLFDRKLLEETLNKNNLSYQMKDSFNPFYRPGQKATVPWRFDLIITK